MTDAPILTTTRLILRGHRPDDLDALAAMWADPSVNAKIGGQPRSREEVWIRLLRSIGTWTAFGYGSWVLTDRESGALVGELGLLEARRTIAPPIDDRPETGWALVPAAWGRGLASEGLSAALGWADAAGIGRTVCIIDPANLPSIRLAGRAGYRARLVGRYHDRPIGIYDRG